MAQAALKTHRQRAYDDFEAVAADIEHRGFATPKQLGSVGASNGGLLVTATMVERPDLFGAVVCQRPLIDMLRYTPLRRRRVLGRRIWRSGRSQDARVHPEIFAVPESEAGVKYPPVLFITETSDDRVTPVFARMMAAKMEAHAPGRAVLREHGRRPRPRRHARGTGRDVGALLRLFRAETRPAFARDAVGSRGARVRCCEACATGFVRRLEHTATVPKTTSCCANASTSRVKSFMRSRIGGGSSRARSRPPRATSSGVAARVGVFIARRALIHDHDALQPLDGGEPVRDDDGGAARHQIGEAALDQSFVLGVERACRLVEQKQRRVAQDRARDGDALALSAGQRRAALADDGFDSPSAALSMNSAAAAASAACCTSASLASGRP